jgi:DNA-binding GntR family transcriptional regulator
MADGLLDIMPRKGIIIGEDSLNDVLTGLEARSVVEPHITALAADSLAHLQESLHVHGRLRR